MRKIIFMGLLLLTSVAARATDYYVCDCQPGADVNCQPGNDSSDGLTSQTPWRTYDYAQDRFGAMQAGDSVSFCQGGFHQVEGVTRWVNLNCRANNRCTIGDYEPPWGSGDEGRPILNALNSDGFRLENGGQAVHREGMNIQNLELRGTPSSQGIMFYNDMDDVTIDNVKIDGFRIGVHMAGANLPPSDPNSNGKQNNNVLRNSEIINCMGQGYLGGCDNCVIENSTFTNNGFGQAIFNHNIYYSSHERKSGGIIRNNRLYRSAIVDGRCQGASLVVHGVHDDLLIENNLVWEDEGAAGGGCWGIAVDPGYPILEQFDRLVIRGNRVINVGNVSIGCQGCTNAVIENNVVINNQAFGQVGIAVPNKDDTGNAETTNVTVRNNSVYLGPNASGTGIRVGREGTGHTVVNNAVQYAGTSSQWNCFDLNLAPANYRAVDHNLCYFPNSTGGEWEDGSGTLTAWQNASPFDDHSLVGNPLFRNPASPDFDLSLASNNSPLVNAGHPTLSAATDHVGNNRNVPPDIGAFEFGSTPDTPPPPQPPLPVPTVTPTPTPTPEADAPELLKTVFNPLRDSALKISCQNNIKVVSRHGENVRDLSCTSGNAFWDGKNSSGKIQSSGIYVLQESGTPNRKIALIK